MSCRYITLKRKDILPPYPAVEVPYSKSISNRLLIIRDLANSSLQIQNLSSSDDTQILKKFLQETANKTNNTFYCKNAGTVLRFLLALLSLKEGKWILDADKRMQTRPLMPLIDILKSLGADIETANAEDIFPIVVNGRKLFGNKTIELDENLTSQIISALLLISPMIKGGITLVLPHNQTSMPYIDMTIALVNHFGGQIQKVYNTLVCSESVYNFNKFSIEKDYSAVAIIYLMVAVGKLRNLRVNHLQTSSLQGDSICKKLFKNFGIATSFDENGAILSYNDDLVSENQVLEFDLLNNPDLFCPIAVAGFLSGKKICIKNIANLRVKESNRLANMIVELNKLDNRCKETGDCLIIESIFTDNTHKQLNINNIVSDYWENICKGKSYCFKTYNDHRIAMSLSAIFFVCREITIENPACVEKSFPNFWEQIQQFSYQKIIYAE